MAATVSNRNIHGGTSMVRGIDDRRRDTYTEEVYVKGLDGTQDDVYDAAEAAASVAGSSHPASSTLVPRAVRAWKDKGMQPGHARATITYSRFRADYIPDEVVGRLASIRGTTRGITWYRQAWSASASDAVYDSAGRPNGDFADPINVENQERRPTPYNLPTSIQVITIPTVLAFDPYPYVITKLNSTNDSALTWIRTGYTYSPNTLYFPPEGLNIDYIETSSGLKYRVNYTFLFNPNGWQQQDVNFDSTTAGEWDTELVDMYKRTIGWVPTTVAATGFPVHKYA